jgi:uncharacterized repeat protein (TIGR03837 family)
MDNYQNKRWDFFCKIVDNFGDIGICWRLSQQLVKEHHCQVRLFIDDLTTAKKIIPALVDTLQQQSINGVEISTWPTMPIEPATVVIGAFACELPDTYIQLMPASQSVWVNLEYLSAEDWVSDYHAKPSPHPSLAITKHFYFPGFKSDTGGLIRESNLIKARDNFVGSETEQLVFWQKLGAFNEISEIKNSIKISLFCYPQANIQYLILALMSVNKPVDLFVPADSTIKSINEILIDFEVINAKMMRKANITMHFLPFLCQAEYDHLLWACDLNFVRGEDSWIRAIWAGKPFIWQPYIQTEHTHITKLNAFLEVYSSTASHEIKSLLADAHLSWSNVENSDLMSLQHMIKHLPKLSCYAQLQANLLAEQTDLATKLVSFSENLVKNKV